MENEFIWTPRKRFNACTLQLFDYMISSHVVKHVPDLLVHFIEVASFLKPRGQYIFVIPKGHGAGGHFNGLSE